MTDLWIPPNMEALVSAFLRDQAELTDLVGDRIYTAIPKRKTEAGQAAEYPLVRVTQLLDTPAGAPLYAVGYEMQVEAFGGSKAEAWRIASTARALIDVRLLGDYPGFGVVNGTTPGALLDLPDEDLKPAKPRWLFSSTIYGRPGATLTS